MQCSNKGNSTSRSKCHFGCGFLHHDFLHDKKILYPANQHPFTVGFSDSCCCEIFSVCLHSARPSAHSFWHRRGAWRTSAGECRRLKVIQRATPQPSRLPKIFGGSGNESWPGFQTSPSPLTGNGNTVKANNGLQPSGRHNKVNHPYQDGSSARVQQISVWIISWIDFICCICNSLCS